MGGSGAEAPKPNIYKDISKYVGGYTKALPQVVEAEQQYRPQFLGLNLGDVSTFLQGTDGQMGIMGLSGLAQQQTGEQLQAARQQELAGMTGGAGAFRGFAQALSPESQGMVEAQQAEAQRATASAQGLTPQERRMAEQSAREAYASRGRVMGNEAIVAEGLGRENILAGKRAEAAQARQGAFGMAQDFYSRPGYGVMGSTPMSYQAGQQALGIGLNAIGSGTPQMINPDMGVNLAMQHSTNQMQSDIANQSASAQRFSGLMQGLGSIGGAAIPFI